MAKAVPNVILFHSAPLLRGATVAVEGIVEG